jgi:vanillate O-demethylase monooxygenase subunit
MAKDLSDKPMGRKVCNESIVFYRDAQGVVQAVEDFCPHRGAPLSLGRVVNGKSSWPTPASRGKTRP